MPVSFNQIPAGIRVPFLYAEFDNSGAVQGAGVQPYKTLMIGQKLAAGTQAAETKVLVTSAEQANTLFGEGSQLATMAKPYLDANKFNELHCVALDDAGGGVKSAGSFQVTGAPTKAGSMTLYVAGRKAQVAVTTADTAITIASALIAVMVADAKFLVDAVVDGVDADKINFTAKNAGIDGDNIDIRANYFLGDEYPAGVGALVVAMNAGAGNPDLADALAILDDEQFILIVSPYTDASNLLVMETELTDRFGPIKQNDGYHITGARGDLSTLNALGDSRNSQFTVIKRCTGPSMPYEHSASVAGILAGAGQLDPARPFQTLALPGILAEDESEKFDLQERDILLRHGIATDKVDSGGVVRIERVITTYKKNPAGADDISYLDLNTLLTLSYIRYDFRNFWLNKYPRHKLAGDEIQFGAGQAIMTPKLAKAEAVIKFRQWENLGLVEDIEQFKEELIVERNQADPNRLDFFLPPNLVNQLRVVGTKIGFIL